MRNLTINDPVIKDDGKITRLGNLGGGSEDLGGLKFRESDEGKAQYKLPDSDEWQDFSSGGATQKTLVWTNPNPTSGVLYPTDVTWDSIDFDYFIVETINNKMSIVYQDVANIISDGFDGSADLNCRDIANISATGCKINNGYKINFGRTPVSNPTICIPKFIYAIKEN